MKLLGIETSCDETAASVVENERVLSNVVYSQAEVHAKTGGVIPEIAARHHTRKIGWVIEEAFNKTKDISQVTYKDIDAIAVTRGPGLEGSLLVGIMTAKALGYALKIPVLGMDHIEAHLLSPMISFPLDYPFIGMVVSGGHTSMVHCLGFRNYQILGTCLDDAAGEAFDKVGKLFGLAYPAGKEIDEISQQGNPKFVLFPRAMIQKDNLNFSFSGLKTAVLNYVQKNPPKNVDIPHILASFQEAIVDTLITKLMKAVQKTNVRTLTLSGGVACNKRLREKLHALCEKNDMKVFFSHPEFSTDNATMIAALGIKYLNAEIRNDDFEVEPHLRLK